MTRQLAQILAALALASPFALPVDAAAAVRGAVVKGPLRDAQVQLFALDDAGFARGPALATLNTDANGRFEFERPAEGQALLAVTRGGSYVDESDPASDPARRRRIVLGPDQGFEAILPAGASTLVITPYTHARLLQVRRAAGGANFLAYFATGREQSARAFGFDPAAVLPEPPLTPAADAPLDAKSYAMLLGGAALAIQAQSLAVGTVPNYATVRAFIEDLSDGRIDGVLDGTPVRVGLGDSSPALPAGVSLNNEVQRFANNNFAAYAGVPLARVDEDALALVPRPDNLRPVTTADTYTATGNRSLSVAAPGVLANDSDPDQDALSVALIDTPAHGSLALALDGGFVYTPAAGFEGNDRFSYRASDGRTRSILAEVAIRVDAATPQAPVAAKDSYELAEDGVLRLAAPGVLANDLNQGRGVLRAEAVDAPRHGALDLAADGGFEYRPQTHFNGSDAFSYRALNDDGSSAPVTVRLRVAPVNDPPEALADRYSTGREQPLQVAAAQGLLANDRDLDGDALSVALESPPAHGQLLLAADGGFLYTPDTGFDGADRFRYRSSDGRAQSAATTVSIDVQASAQPPVAVDDAYVATEDSVLRVAAPGLLGNDRDPDGSALSAALAAAPAHGRLVLAADGGFRYIPDPDFSGEDQFSYRAADAQRRSAPARVRLSVTPTEDPPSGTVDAYTVAEGGTLSVAAAGGLLANDHDPDGDALQALLLTAPAHGTVELAADGSFRYTHDGSETLSDGFVYRSTDGKAFTGNLAVSLTIGPVNDAPLATADLYRGEEDAALSVAAPGVLANDQDADGPTLKAALHSPPVHGTLAFAADGHFTYTPDRDFSGTDSFAYRASDGSTGLSEVTTVSLEIAPANDAPTAHRDSYEVDQGSVLSVNAARGLLGNDEDPDGDILRAVSVGSVPAAKGTLEVAADGSFRFTPADAFSGSLQFSYKASDGALSSAFANVSITVRAVDPSLHAADDLYQAREDTQLTVAAPGVLANDSASGNRPLSAVEYTRPRHGKLTARGDGGFTYTPALDYHGRDSFTYRLSDGSAPLSNTATVVLEVSNVNDAPVAADDIYTTDRDQVLLVPAAQGLLANDSDAEGTALTALLAGPVPASEGELQLGSDGSFRFTPAAGFTGTVRFDYRASDGSKTSDNASVSIGVLPPGQAPVVSVPAGPISASLFVSGIDGIRVTDPDAGSSPLTLKFSVTGLANLILDSGVAGGVSAAQISGNDSPELTVVASVAQINTSLGTSDGLLFSNYTGRSGDKSITVTAYDGDPEAFGTRLGQGTVDVRVNRLPLASLPGNAGAGTVLLGRGDRSYSGAAVQGLGDINDDGHEDFAVGAPGANIAGSINRPGRSYVVFGRAGGLPNPLDVSALDGSNGFVLDGVGNLEASGFSLGAAGDVNDDGIADLVIGAPAADPGGSGSGRVYVVYGRAGAFPQPFDLGSLDGSQGYAITGAAGEALGHAVAGAGDINDDGFDDLVLGAPDADVPAVGNDAGRAYVVYGHAPTPGAAVLHTADLDGANGFRLLGRSAGDRLGQSVAVAGDFDHDGFDDLLVGTRLGGSAGPLPGAALIRGGAAIPASIGLQDLNGSRGFVIRGPSGSAAQGLNLGRGGDFNGDDALDLLLGAGNNTQGWASSYVLFGGAAVPAGGAVDLAALDGNQGFRIAAAAGEGLGAAVSSVGDFDLDGIDDLLVSAPGAAPEGIQDAGTSYLVFGRAGIGSGGSFELDRVFSGLEAIRFDGANAGDQAGLALGAAGDSDGDGHADLLIGAPYADRSATVQDAGQTYLIFGSALRSGPGS